MGFDIALWASVGGTGGGAGRMAIEADLGTVGARLDLGRTASLLGGGGGLGKLGLGRSMRTGAGGGGTSGTL